LLEDTAGAIVVVFLNGVVVEVFKDIFPIPTEEPETVVRLYFIVEDSPVMVIPVGITPVEIEEHVIGQVDDVHQGSKCRVTAAIGVVAPEALIGRVGGQPCIGHGHHLLPGLVGAIHHTAGVVFYHVEIGLLSVEIGLSVVFVEAFGQGIKTPEQAIDVNVAEPGVTGGVPHGALHVFNPDIAVIGAHHPVRMRPVGPGVTESGSEDDLVLLGIESFTI